MDAMDYYHNDNNNNRYVYEHCGWFGKFDC
jgi:hypothetical protein